MKWTTSAKGLQEHARERVASEDRVVDELTASERRLWVERAASFDEHSDAGERKRREASRQKAGVQSARDAPPPR